ncbi:MAG TPA: dephospho-CoA kinase [Mycobacteriales bacterium]|nr:dephospho-CoA kinase [Mycobacteriales bacterium]
MLWVGLTGGIGSGKSAVSERLASRGAAVVDADRVAREVVEPGTPGLAAVVEAFGVEVLTAAGALDREALGRHVFTDEDARRRLNGIVHPLIGERTVALAADAEAAGARVLVHDVPLLVEGGLAPGYHLVVVVEAPRELRLQRLTELRGMPADDARARMAAQASDAQRREVADVVLVNDGPLRQLHVAVDRLLAERLEPYADNLLARRSAPRRTVPQVPHDPQWERQGRRLVERLRAVCGTRATAVEHVGSTAVPGLVAQDVLDLQVTCPSRDDAEALGPALAAAGFPRRDDVDGDPPMPGIDADPAQWWKRLHRSADPGRAADVHVRVEGTAAARCAVALRDLLRQDPAARQEYEAAERRLAGEPPGAVDARNRAWTSVLVPLLVRALDPPGGSKK